MPGAHRRLRDDPRLADLRRLAGEDLRRRAHRLRHRDHQPRPDGGQAGRDVLRRRAGRGGLPAAGAPLRQLPEAPQQLPLDEVLDKLRPWLESDAPRQARPEPQVRRPRAGQPRHRLRRRRARHPARVLRAGERQGHDMDSLASATSASRRSLTTRSAARAPSRSASTRSTSRAPPNTPPRTPTSPCACTATCTRASRPCRASTPSTATSRCRCSAVLSAWSATAC
jgi:hypothetical protein